MCHNFNKKINDPEYPGLKDVTPVSDELMEKAKTEYYPCFSPCMYNDDEDDKKYFYLDAHY